jgi:hypothetical protein
MIHKLGSASRSSAPHNLAFARPQRRDELYLKWLLVAAFLPQGLSFFIGDFRITVFRVLLILFPLIWGRLLINGFRSSARILVPSDLMMAAVAIWIVLSGIVTSGLSAGVKSSGIGAVEFVGVYYAFRFLLRSPDSSTRVMRFFCITMLIVTALALLDPILGRLVFIDISNAFGLYGGVHKLVYPVYLESESYYRGGLVRAMGPMDHSILFGSACAWAGIIAVFIFASWRVGISAACFVLVGLWFSQSRGPLIAVAVAISLMIYHAATQWLPSRGTILAVTAVLVGILLCVASGSPLATLTQVLGVGGETAWYREAIWSTAGSLVMHSPLFGLGPNSPWDWQSNPALSSGSVDAFWLKMAMDAGIVGSAMVFLAIVSAFWRGAVDKSSVLTAGERQLSRALALVVAAAVFLGFTVDFYGVTYSLLPMFAGVRASLAECAVVRRRLYAGMHAPCAKALGADRPEFLAQRRILQTLRHEV